jgi:GTP-binding protein LepA
MVGIQVLGIITFMFEPSKIRNFCIVAHIDHGKSTLADRLLEFTGSVTSREMQAQLLDSMEIERERGITIKAQTASMQYRAKDGEVYLLNLIDTPGHVDFSYEVSRSLAACEGAIVVVDASQGVEAQTVANVSLAMQSNLELIPVINKIDLPSADVERVMLEIEEELVIDADNAIPCSAKTGIGIEEILEAIVRIIPPPEDNSKAPLQALIFDSWFDSYLGAVSLCRIKAGQITKGDTITMMSSGHTFEVLKVAILTPKIIDVPQLSVGEVGIIAGSIKNIADTQVGDTITSADTPCNEPLAGFQKAKQMVFGGIFPIDTSDYHTLKDSLEKLCLNDSSLIFEVESSTALGLGFRVGFLGLLHMEIVQERLEREYNLDLIFTAPTVVYRIVTTAGKNVEIENPSKLPDPHSIEEFLEPYVKVKIHCPEEYIGGILKLLNERRGLQDNMEYTSTTKMMIEYSIPMNEMIYDFHDKLKSISRGYASMDYEVTDYQAGDLVRLDILVNGEPVDALACIVHRSVSAYRGRLVIKKLKGILPRQMFQIALQAAIGAKVVARENISALRKDVTAKCYGGDVSRKRKLLEKQKEGKKRMKQIGSVEIPQSAFTDILKLDE